MKAKKITLSVMMSLAMVYSNAFAQDKGYPIINNQTDVQYKNDQPSAKLDPLTTAFIIEVGVPLASSLFNKVFNWFSNNKNNSQQANQNNPVIADVSNNLGMGIQQILRQQCYVYLDRKVKLNKEKYEELVNQFGGLCDILSPTSSSATNVHFPTFNPQYSSPQTTVPLNVKVLEGYGTNYQGLQLQIEMLDMQNNVRETRSIHTGFKSGERFRLKVTPTFTGLLQIQHQGSNGEKERLFPREPVQAIQLNAGQSMTIPADPKRFYYFDDQQGIEQLIVQFIDYKGMNGNFSNNTIFRHDDVKSTYLMQQVSQAKYPYIIQTIEMKHQ